MNSIILLLALTPGAITVEDFGAKGDGITNDSPAIQAAIDFLLSDTFLPREYRNGYNRGGTLVFSDHKRYRCEAPLVIARRGQAVSITLAGETPAYHVGGSPQLIFTYGDRPGIILQTVRNVHIKNLSLQGINDFSEKLESDDDYAIDESYSTGQVRTNRYSPHCAISIDSFDNTVPEADRYSGLDTLYKNGPGSGSKQVHIEGCAITGWHVGIMLNSSSGNSQGDGVFIRENSISICTYAIAIGQSQSRGVDVRDNEFGGHRVVFDTVSFGQRSGTAPHVQGGLIDGVKYLCMCSTVIGNLHITDVYSEVICSLGVINYSSHPNCMPTLFSGCQFKFVKTQKQPEAHLISGGNVKFIGCALGTYGKCLSFQTVAGSDADPPSIEFDNCDLGTTGENAETSIYTNAFTRIRWRNSALFDPYWSAHIATGERHPLTERRQITELARVGRKIVIPGETIITPTETINIDLAENVVPIGKNHDLSFGGNGTATLKLPDLALFKVGDVVRGCASNGTSEFKFEGSTINLGQPKVGVISSIAGNTATLTEVPCCFDDGSVKFPCLEVASMKRFHLPTTGKATTGSNQITNCSVSPAMEVGNAWFVGNRIYGKGIPVGAYISAIDGSTITISKAATATDSAVALYDAKYKIE